MENKEQKGENKHYAHKSMGTSVPLCVGVDKKLLNPLSTKDELSHRKYACR